MRILHLIASVNPKGGGPIEYARMMSEAHKRMGHAPAFVTLDAADAPWVKAFEFPVLAAGSRRRGLNAIRRYHAAVAEAAKDADVAVIHGLWNVATFAGLSALNAQNIPWVTFSHGMLDPYFRDLKPVKHWLKQAVWTAAQGRALSGSYRVLFTCDEEQRLAENAFWGHQTYRSKVVAFCATDLSLLLENPEADFEAFQAQVPALGARRYLLFLSRIHPKKACDNLIKAFASIATDYGDVDLVFAGPDQTGWQKDLQQLAQDCGVEARVHWAGMTSGAQKAAAFANALAFTLPSHQENFGIVVAEALSTRTPVLISKKVNIWKEIVQDHAGLACDDTVESTSRMLRNFLALSDEGRAEIRAATRPCYERRFSVAAGAQDLEAVLSDAIAAASEGAS
ncbi:glycosyltransferase [Celeribacter sp. PS-C1]|uniref:glycosyltransferase n=1 Tax=Celeribacter sp. PS-C1 TaxID=2820813 RepID=UPI001CA4CD6E|nr:glycosyltransferase [Celeribacter sp. PS-C1]MBW6417907.1 glycosyltransferase [Celeribacter sp. PS-C1]